MTEINAGYPEIIRLLQIQVNRGKEAERLILSEDQILPEELLQEYVSKGKQAQTYLHKLKSIHNAKEPKEKYYTEEFPSGPWSRGLYQMRTGKPFSEKEFRESYEEAFKKNKHTVKQR